MNTSAPKKTTLWIAVLLAALAFVGKYTSIPIISAYVFENMAAAFIILLLGVLFKNI